MMNENPEKITRVRLSACLPNPRHVLPSDSIIPAVNHALQAIFSALQSGPIT